MTTYCWAHEDCLMFPDMAADCALYTIDHLKRTQPEVADYIEDYLGWSRLCPRFYTGPLSNRRYVNLSHIYFKRRPPFGEPFCRYKMGKTSRAPGHLCGRRAKEGSKWCGLHTPPEPTIVYRSITGFSPPSGNVLVVGADARVEMMQLRYARNSRHP